MLIAFRQLTLPGEIPISGAFSVFSIPGVVLKADELVNYSFIMVIDDAFEL